MRPDVQEISDFYRCPLGGVARRLIAHRIRTAWPNVKGEALLGIGYAAPFMLQFRNEAKRTLLCMPDEQGAVRWPYDGPGCSFLANEAQMPLPDACVQRVLAVHCLEMCGSVRPLLREIWRVLAPEGRVLLVVPNRRGVWARIDSTPFGHGHPYSRRQLERLLGDSLYAPTGWWPSLFLPPVNRRLVVNTAFAWERMGTYGWPGFSGLLIVEAQKQIYAPVGKAMKAPRGAFQPAHGAVTQSMASAARNCDKAGTSL